MKKKTWLTIMIAVMVAGLGCAGYFLFIHSEAEPLTVSELKAGAASSNGQLKVEGIVAPGSVDWDDKAQTIRFILLDDKEDLNVVYQGTVPDNFKPGSTLIVEGQYSSNGVFEAYSFGSRRSICVLCH